MEILSQAQNRYISFMDILMSIFLSLWQNCDWAFETLSTVWPTRGSHKCHHILLYTNQCLNISSDVLFLRINNNFATIRNARLWQVCNIYLIFCSILVGLAKSFNWYEFWIMVADKLMTELFFLKLHRYYQRSDNYCAF